MPWKDQDKNREAIRKWKLAHPEKTKAYKRKWRQATPEKHKVYDRRKHLLKSYGLSLSDYQQLYTFQEGKCLICKIWYPILAVDHDHKTGKVRALLCTYCNGGIGMFKESAELIERAALYLRAISD